MTGGSSTNGAQAGKEATTLQIWHSSHARTASNVLAKQFRDHAQLAPKEYTFMTAFIYGPEKMNNLGGGEQGKHIFIKEHVYFMLDPRVLATRFPPSDSRPLKPCPMVVDQTVNGAGQDVDSVNGSSIVKKTNPSVLPDSFIRTLSPIFQIRHPAISIPSYFRAVTQVRAEEDVFDLGFITGTTCAWTRITFDWFCEHVYPQWK
ncbi:MAG: hypothetical protein Q9166_006677 [cf. Caloplaca sp. 2 TL-2023]